jgi:hypothetical protein
MSEAQTELCGKCGAEIDFSEGSISHRRTEHASASHVSSKKLHGPRNSTGIGRTEIAGAA